MKRAFLFGALIFLMVLSGVAQTSVRTKYNFNSEWKLFVGDPDGAETPGFDDREWKPISIPHAWNEDSAFRVSIHDLPTGTAWYRKHFRLPNSSQGNKVFIEFEGIRQAGDFYLNGKFLGRSENGVMAFGFDLTPYLNPGGQENVLAARITNSWDYREETTNTTFEWNNRNFYANYGGINKNVFLYVTGNVYQTLPLYENLKTTGTYIYATEFDLARGRAVVHAESEIRNETDSLVEISFQVVVKETSGKSLAALPQMKVVLAPKQTKTVSVAGEVQGLHFWSWGYGYLYDVETALVEKGKVIDLVRTRTGFRKTEFGHGVARLNDRTIQFKGYAQRTTNEWPAIGLSVPAWVSDFSNGLMVHGNANLVRWMHVTPWKQDVESCDRVGLIENMPAGDAEKDASGRQWEQRVELMRDAIIYNRNNPSILFYESGNKGISEEHMAEMKKIRDQYDPYGGRALGAREMLDSKIAEYGGEMLYINKSARIPFWSMEYSRDEGARKYWDNDSPPFHKDSPLYNRNQDSHAIEDVTRWYDYFRERPGSGYRVNDGGTNIIFSDSNTHFRGDDNYRHSGEVDAMRLPKEGYFADQAMWDGWVDIERQHTYILGHWNYRPGTVKDEYVVSTADKVELFLNGHSLGYGTRSVGFLFTFKKVPWKPGTLLAVGYDAAGKKITEASKTTAGGSVAIRLIPHLGPKGFRADGSDLALVDVEVVDAKGNRCPTDLSLIHFQLTGAAEWRGGIAEGSQNYILSKDLPVEGGVNRVILRSLPQAGSVMLQAFAQGLRSAQLDLHTVPVKANNGLSVEMPEDGLTSDLSRGATPTGESFHPWRTPIQIIGATAGAHSTAQEVAASFDDDEVTSWKSDGDLSHAWIEYQLAETSTIAEAALKLIGWRERSYPIVITVDGKEVFRGSTPKSLGYVTLPLTAARGRVLRIQMTGPYSEGDAFSNVVEITGKKESTSGTEGRTQTVRTTLGIVEAEVYGPHRADR